MGRTSYGSSDWGLGYALQKIDEEYAKLKWLSEKELKEKNLKKIQCPRCSKFVFLKEGKSPWIVKCPHCCDEKEKAILKWLYIMNPNNEVFDQCPSCNQYGFISAINQDKYIEFICKNCKERYFIFKKDAIPI
jgi:hypothetical protein